MEVIFLEIDSADYDAVAEVILQLRPHYEQAGLLAQIRKQKTLGYQLVYVKSAQGILAVAGFQIGEKLAWGKHLYVDDLVTNADRRSSGVGRFLLDWLKTYAREQGCKQLHLDSGVQRFAAHKFYLREGFHISSHHFALTDI